MSILVSNIKIGLNQSDSVAIDKAISKLKIEPKEIKSSGVYKKSLDARKRDNIIYVVSVTITLQEKTKEADVVKNASDPFVVYKPTAEIQFLPVKTQKKIAVIGFGPSGIFCSLALSDMGYDVTVFEQGEKIEDRVKSIDEFTNQGELNVQSNIQFGEGGAGTFSDGKLTTRINDERCRYVLEQLVKFGAPQEILTIAKPHIGTDKLRNVIINIRKHIEKNSNHIHFNSKMEKLIIKNGVVKGVVVNSKSYEFDKVVLAIGHSSRESFEMLNSLELPIQAKPFSVGVRIEQLQTTINRGLYGALAENKTLPTGEYQLSYKQDGRCVYTFCMCPGGYVVPSSSELNSVVVNGMSEHSRDGTNANSALVVSVDSADYGTNSPLDGMYFQQKLEQTAFNLGGRNYKAPATTIGDFLKYGQGLAINTVNPTYSLGVSEANFNDIFSSSIVDMLKTGLIVFDRKLKGFSHKDGVLTGVETRTSSPIKIIRNEKYQSEKAQNLYPCGEGAGYAGGIMSASVDGIKIAQAIMSDE